MELSIKNKIEIILLYRNFLNNRFIPFLKNFEKSNPEENLSFSHIENQHLYFANDLINDYEALELTIKCDNHDDVKKYIVYFYDKQAKHNFAIFTVDKLNDLIPQFQKLSEIQIIHKVGSFLKQITGDYDAAINEKLFCHKRLFDCQEFLEKRLLSCLSKGFIEASIIKDSFTNPFCDIFVVKEENQLKFVFNNKFPKFLVSHVFTITINGDDNVNQHYLTYEIYKLIDKLNNYRKQLLTDLLQDKLNTLLWN